MDCRFAFFSILDIDCVYTFYVKTGSIIRGGNISITLGDPSGRLVWVPNLRSWGLMGPNHDYFECGNIDIFGGRGPCVPSQLDIRWVRVAPQLVLRLRPGHHRRTSQKVWPDRILR
ncbi:hypothetical protein Ddye_013334 [Dipteronia dyeriana]|uniref:Uncharacterized protein n=1 Tax=Dipteronia dyeriana TaxID=168575 RepID=A0AAD9X623_9ROSI|nr:hypothetical protein Ddye_013334 [Dipteronia dyeriana]